jgi:asparagine synthase (glutamine-hydrolysing)
MCGINGIVSSALSASERGEMMHLMNVAIQHRGPDNLSSCQHGHTNLGHARLSIIDLSAESNQPFYSFDTNYVIVFNGEVYNFKELKTELQRVTQGQQQLPYFFKTNSDTEVVLAAYLRWGKECLNYLQGMFAFAILNIQTQEIFIARDRMGVKPLYYHYSDKGFVFSSEIRAILKSGIKQFELNKSVLQEYAQYQTVSAPNTIVKGINVLLPGHFLELQNDKVSTTCYWKAETFIKPQQDLSYEATCSKINELLTHAVQKRLVSDVPFGAFLSGGIDSSIIVGLMAKVSSSPIQTFNISFDESEFSESIYAKEIAKRFNTQHHEIRLTPTDFLNQLPEALSALDHPSGDGINTYIVSKATKLAGITMALSGIGGDELFAGYANFKRLHQLQTNWKLNLAPSFVKNTVALTMRSFSKSISRTKIAEVLEQDNFKINTTYPLSRSVFTQREMKTIVKDTSPLTAIQQLAKSIPVKKDFLLSTISVLELRSYLHDVLLRDTDQMAMAVALEVREPFLDHRLVEFVLGIKDEQKYPHTQKKLLTDSIKDLIPAHIINRPKMGFTLPWAIWMQTDLKLFCEQQINELDERNLFQPNAIKQLWQRFLSNDPLVPWSRLWHFIVLNHWLNTHQLE